MDILVKIIYRSFILTGLSSFFLPAIAGGASVYDKWKGEYKYVAVGPRDLGGLVPTIEVTLTIALPGSCEIVETGFQTDGRIKCSISRSLQGINVKFKIPMESNVGIAAYRLNEKLFLLSIAPGDGRLITEWLAMRPEYATTSKGVYFSKVIIP